MLRFFDWGANPAGVPRVCLELLSAIPCEYRHLAKFCRLSTTSCRFEEINLSAIRKIYPIAEVSSAGRAYETDFLKRTYQLLRSAIPVSGRILRDLCKGAALQQQFERSIKPGEFVVSLGAPWQNPNYATHMAEAKKRLGFKFAPLIHDIIPINHPYVRPETDVTRFRAWLEQILTVSDLIFTASDHTRQELEQFGRVRGYGLPRIQAIRFGATVRHAGTKQQYAFIKQLRPFVLHVRAYLC